MKLAREPLAWLTAAALAFAAFGQDAKADEPWDLLTPRYSLTEIDLGDITHAAALSNDGLVAGAYWHTDANFGAFLYDHGELEELGTMGGLISWAYGLNDHREVVGYSTNADGSTTRSFLYQNGVMHDLDALVGKPIGVFDINNSGQMTGGAQVEEPLMHAFVLTDGVIRDIGTLGGPTSWGRSINDQGMVTGASDVPGGNGAHVFLYRDGAMMDLDGLGCCGGVGNDVNEMGDVTGQSRTPGLGGDHAFLYTDGAMRDLGTLGGSISLGLAINNKRSVVGVAQTESGQYRPFLYLNGVMHDLNDLIDPGDPLAPDVELDFAADINDHGEIVADGFNSRTGRSATYLLTPKKGGGGVIDGQLICMLTFLLVMSRLQVRFRP